MKDVVSRNIIIIEGKDLWRSRSRGRMGMKRKKKEKGRD